MFEEVKKIRLQRLWCQHCKALQKTNDTVVECWYNPLEHGKEGAFCAANVDAIKEICQLFEPKPQRHLQCNHKEMNCSNMETQKEQNYGICLLRNPFDCPFEAKPDEGRLLSKEKRRTIINSFFPGAPEAVEVNKAMLEAQRDLTASIKDAEDVAQREHMAHLIDDVINLEEKLKIKDAEISYWREKCWNDTMSAKKSGYDDARAENQARVERILREIERYFKFVTEQKPPVLITDFMETKIWWQTLKKQEGVRNE